MANARLRWAGWTAFGLVFLWAGFWILAWLCRVRTGMPLQPGFDPLVSRLPIKDWTWFLSGGYILFLACFYIYWLRRAPGRLPYLLATTGLLMLIRDVFIWLTPVAPLTPFLPLYSWKLVAGLRNTMAYDQELFFSGHTGVPFLYFLASRRYPAVRWTCLAVSLLNGIGVMLTRNHYSLDVLGAFFIVPTIYWLSRALFGALDPEPEGASA